MTDGIRPMITGFIIIPVIVPLQEVVIVPALQTVVMEAEVMQIIVLIMVGVSTSAER